MQSRPLEAGASAQHDRVRFCALALPPEGRSCKPVQGEPGLGHLDFSLADAAATRALGARLAAACRPDSVILLRGPLGAGKTTLVDGFLEALGAGSAASPTFVIAHLHNVAATPVWHLDLYRLEDPADIEDLDLAQYLPSGGITLVEWPERAPHVWPADRIEIDLAIAGTARTARIEAFGSAADVVQSAL